ncbi:MAG: hypothetical protein Q4D13_05270 [Erysipelotrichaceae bacterium]|nr:hypothetical protein [Erysipelotrichaceae bacterium]
MKRCVIRNEYTKADIGYLFYSEKEDVFTVEISDETDRINLPLFLSAFKDKGKYTMNPYWARRFVQRRIVPRDRQNIGSILRNAGLKKYDPYRLLILANGKCCQDECSIKPLSDKKDMESWYIRRKEKYIKSACLLDNEYLLIELNNNSLFRINLHNYLTDKNEMVLLERPYDLNNFKVIPNGLGIMWDEDISLMAEDIKEEDKEKDISGKDLERYMETNILTTADVCKELDCTRQYLNSLVQSGRIKVFRKSGNNSLFLKSELINLK